MNPKNLENDALAEPFFFFFWGGGGGAQKM